MINKTYTSRILVVLWCVTSMSACKKLIEVDLPIDKNTAETVYANTSTAVAAMTGIYAQMGAADGIFMDDYGLSIRTALRSDELATVIPGGYPEYLNAVSGNDGWELWSTAYREHIYRLNALIEGVQNSTTLPNNSKTILLAEAKFTRAWIYFYLINLYGDVPLVLTTNFEVNSNIARTPKNQVYDQIVKDLLEAQANLKNEFLQKDLSNTTNERIRPNKAAATALLARVYFYLEKWSEAEAESTKVIDDPNYALIEDLSQVFLKNSKEAIWQWQPNSLDPDGTNAPDGRFLINPYGGDPFFFASDDLRDAFEPNDKRKDEWLNTRPSGFVVPYKYKEEWGAQDQKEYTMVLRFAEQYLIRAEARARQNNLKGDNSAESDLNVIRLRAGLPGTTAVSQSDFLINISKERRVELFLEWGDRWFDLIRIGQLDAVMSVAAPKKGTSWAPYKALLPIPYNEFNYNPTLRGHQNPGYLEQP